MEALRKIQQELKVHKGQTNKFGGYRYRSCEDIMEAVKPLLTKHKCTLTLSDDVCHTENVPMMIVTDESTKPKTKSLTIGSLMYIQSTATLVCGEEIHAVTAQAGIDINKAGMDTAQCFGSSSSYARKFALTGLFLLDDTQDSDATNKHNHEDYTPTAKVPDAAAYLNTKLQALIKSTKSTADDFYELLELEQEFIDKLPMERGEAFINLVKAEAEKKVKK